MFESIFATQIMSKRETGTMITVEDIPDGEIDISAIRASGPGGQHVNKVSTAIHLRFDIMASSIPANVKTQLTRLSDRRISADNVVHIKAQRFRSQEKNRLDAIERLDKLLAKAQLTRKVRRPTKPGKAAVRKRLDDKSRLGRKKEMRRKSTDWD